ncbi:MAG: C1 family peptidase [Bacilli bacterium]|nr:C1 family peptidase [Bacilli bacterium]
MENIKLEILNSQLKEYQKDAKHTVLRHAFVGNSLKSIVTDQDAIKDYDFNFSINIDTLPVANQKASGRCWIFAATNFLREKIAKKCNIANFELSQSYIAFYDRLEKVNYTLEAIIELIDEDYDDRTLSWIVANGIGDGGQWDMFVNVVNKYGLCPKNAFPETATSSGTAETNSLINFNIRKFASEAKALKAEKGLDAVKEMKAELLKKVYFLLVDAYGVPPQEFAFEYTNKENKYHREGGFTPLSFKEKYIGNLLDDYVSLINAPTKDKPFNRSYTIKYLGNVVGGKDVTHLNLPMERLKELILAQLKDNEIVWFGSDVAFYGDRQLGSWDDNRFDALSAFGLDWKMDKGESIDFHASQMNHAMCITGVNLIDDKPTKWKIENSWGGDVAKAGYYIMSDTWFDQFVYQAVVNKKYLSEEERKAYETKPVVLKPWDPMGSLAD